ncbi:MAG: SDR family NAD(P)-dependent oxidoreductase [Dehalococcoidia bacterium]|nr:SDR family NAD(P)-dependent oxidoreductase [Dehalococcoidia bacterium]
MDLGGKVAIVTGAGSGVVREITDVLGREEAHIAADDINFDKAIETVKIVTAQNGSAAAFKTGVIDYQELSNAVTRIISACGHVDILVNNAGYGILKISIQLIYQIGWRI